MMSQELRSSKLFTSSSDVELGFGLGAILARYGQMCRGSSVVDIAFTCTRVDNESLLFGYRPGDHAVSWGERRRQADDEGWK